MQSLFNFFKYNNLVPIALGVLFLGSGAAFAATDPQAIYSQEQKTISVDNTYIAGKDLSLWTPRILINSVTEDADNYYVAYSLATIDVVDYAWRDAAKSQIMTVNKADLGVRDLGVYVTGQFRNIISNELAYLRAVQEKAKNEPSQRVVATTYGGLIGKFLDSTTETLPGYTPVVQPPHDDSQAAAVADSGSASGTAPTSPGTSGSSNLMSLQVLGNNPARVPLGGGYIDLGVVLLDPSNPNIGYHAFVDGTPSDPPNIDTSTTSAHIIEYRAIDQAGAVLKVARVVIVGDAPDPGGEINTAGSVPTIVQGEVAAPPPAPAPEPAATTTTSVMAPADAPPATTTPQESLESATTTP